MFQEFFSKASPSLKITFALILIPILFLVFFAFGMAAAIPIFGINLENMQEFLNFENIKNLNFLKYIQAIQSIGLFIVPSVLLAFLFQRKWTDYLQFSKKPNLFSMLIIVGLVITAVPFVNFLADFNSRMTLPGAFAEMETWMKTAEESAQKMTEAFLKADSVSVLFVNLFVIAILPAIGEELLFRGIFQRLFTEMFENEHAGIIIAASLFSFLHMQFYGFLPRMVLGMIFGYMLLFSRSLWLPVIAHFINNAFAVLAYYFYYHKSTENIADTIGTDDTIYFAFLSFAVLIFSMYLLKRNEERLLIKS